jgi:hypothetical protein
MNYNILTVANDVYFELLFIYLQSLCVNCDIDKIENIFIQNLGINDANIVLILKLSKKIEILNSDFIIADSKKIYSKGWVDAVSQKTRFLKKLSETGNLPLIMMDSDMIVIEDFSKVIDPDYDIQVCQRDKPLFRPDGLIVNYIASFFIVNNTAGIKFINDWIQRMEERINLKMIPPHETPAMVETIEKNKDELKIGFLEDKIVSCENNYIPHVTKVVHAKGRTIDDKISISRFSNIKHLPYWKIINLFDDSKKIRFTLLFLFKKIINIYDIKDKSKNILRPFFKKIGLLQ